MMCSFSSSKDSSPPAAVAVSPRKQTKAPKFHSFCLIPVFMVFQAQGCTILNVHQPIQVFLASQLSAFLLLHGCTSIREVCF